jgi:uncharacterized membrane protein
VISLFEEKRRFRLIMPSLRTILATMAVAAVGFLVSIAYMVLFRHERAFWDMLTFSTFVVIITFITAYIIDYLSHE